MVKELNLLILICILAVAIVAYPVAASNLDEERITDYGIIKNPVCYENGAVEVFVTSMEEGNIILPKFVKGIGAVFQNENTTIDLKRYWYDKEGYWYNDDYSRMRWATKMGEKAIFISDEYVLNKKGNYTIRISGVPMDIAKFFPDAIVYEFNFSCPGYLHSCRYLNPKIEDCYTMGDNFYAYLTGMGEKRYSKINISRDVEFSLNYETYGGTVGYLTPMPESRKIFRLGNDRYVLKIPTDDLDDNIESMKIDVNGCITGFHNLSDYSSCGNRIEEISRDEIIKIISDETIINSVLNISEEIKKKSETEDRLQIERPKPIIVRAFQVIYDMVPVKEGALREFLIELGKY